MTLAATSAGGIPVLAILAAVGPLAAAIAAIVMLGPQRAKLVGESLGDAVEDLRAELTAVREERNGFRDERDHIQISVLHSFVRALLMD